MTQPNGAAAIARLASRPSVTPGLCLWYVQDAWQVPHLYPDAYTQWEHTVQHTDMAHIPHGAPVFWSSASGPTGDGHIAIWDQNRQAALSTDVPKAGVVGWANLAWFGQTWGSHLVGWGSTLGGVTLPLTAPVTPPKPTLPPMSLRHLRASILEDGPAPFGSASNRANTLPVEQALWDLGYRGFVVDGSAGSATFGPGSAYQRWQVRLGYVAGAADGYPPAVLTTSCSLARLASSTRRFHPVP